LETILFWLCNFAISEKVPTFATMLSINNISFYFGSRALYDGASLHVKPKDKIGLIGANGTGKSTLLRLIDGEYQADSGTISRSGDCTIAFLNQDLLSYQSEESILSVAMQAFHREVKLQAEIDEILQQMEVEYTDDLLDRLTKAQTEFEGLDGYTMQSKTEAILEGLGFKTEDLQRPLSQFSGGWRMRVMLAKMLLQRPSLLMLDEPTNHLDLPSIEWVENYLYNYEGAVMVVSHDREFLDNVCDTIAEVAQQKINIYAGNYSFYLEERELRREIQQGAYENQQAQIRQTERFIQRFKAKASKSRQVQSRVKSLERLEMIDQVANEAAKVNFRFTFTQQPGRTILELENVSKSYGDLHLLHKTNVNIERGDKIGLIGANGKGKSTLLRILSGMEIVDGERKEGYNVQTTLFAQHQLEALNVENTIIDEMKECGSNKTETELRTILGCFLFTNDEVFKKIKVLSGGEKSRVALAKTLVSNANFLLLDEPTNHLDIQSVNILIQALHQYEGTFVVISHDRHFVATIANKIWYIEGMQIKEYPGNYDEFVYWLESNGRSIMDLDAAPKKDKKDKVETVVSQTVLDKESKQKQLKNVQKQLEIVEQKIADLEKQVKSFEAELAKPSVYQNTAQLAEITEKYNKTKKYIIAENETWEKLMIEADSLQ
jgi:ATP-binding cassette subfamily F protein 3